MLDADDLPPLYDNISSLRTIDDVIEHNLFRTYNVSYADYSSFQKHKLATGTLLLHHDQLLTEKECQEIIHTVEQLGFDNSVYEKRNANRRCIIDKKLADKLLLRVYNLIHAEKLKPYGLDINPISTWKLLRINECFRISKYTSPSSGFAEHYDRQYCNSPTERSIATLIIYLNNDFTEGETIFFDKENKIYQSDITVADEIKLNGGIDTFDIYTIRPLIGRCVIFEHTLLHKSTPITTGTKYLLRTDIIYTSNDPVIWGIPYEYDKCLRYFKEAQYADLEGKNSSELYERSQSICMSYGKQSAKYNSFSWNYIITFLDNIIVLRRVCRFLYILKLNNNHLSFDSFSINRKLDFEQKYIPAFHFRKQGNHVFEYNDIPYFNENKLKCLKVVTMLTLVKCNCSQDEVTYVASYDPKTRKIIACTIPWLSYCIFNNLPCYGRLYNISTNIAPQRYVIENKLGKRKDPTIEYQFQHNIDDFLRGDSPRSSFEKLAQNISEKDSYITNLTKLAKLPSCSIFSVIRRRETYSTEKKMYLNSLIFDFSKHNIVITKQDSKAKHEECYIADISELKIPKYNHAGHVAFHNEESTTGYCTKFIKHRLINKVQFTITRSHKHVKIVAKYNSIYFF